MSNLKDTDIDDLFRRASDKYPLRTDSSDWDRMAAALEKSPPPNPPNDPDETDDRRKRRFFWLFFLLPLAGAGYLFWHHPGNGHPAVATTQTAKMTTQPATTTTQSATATPPSTTQAPDAQPNTVQAKTAQNTGAKNTNIPNTNSTATIQSTPTPAITNTATAAGQAGVGMPRKVHRMF